MVANAGRIVVKPMVDCKPTTSLIRFQSHHIPIATLADFDRVFNTNVRGTFLCLRAAAQTMIKQGRGGRIISIYGLLFFCFG